jgi:predicted PurR-regulated permease PerM
MNDSNRIGSLGGLKIWIILASSVILIAGLKMAAQMVTLFLLAVLLTAISLAPFDWLKKKGLREPLVVLIILVGLWLITMVIVLLVGSSLNGFLTTLPHYQDRMESVWVDLQSILVYNGFLDKDFDVFKQLNPSQVFSWAGNVFSGISYLVSNSILVVLIFVFMLLEVTSFKNKLTYISPASLSSMDRIVTGLKKYFGIKILTSLATGIFISLGLAILGLDFPVLWGILAFLLNFIPNIGSVIAAGPAVLLAFLQLPLFAAMGSLVLYIAVNFIIGNVLEPKWMGKSLGLSSFVVFISLIIWGWILGTVGMLISVPLTMALKIVLDEKPETRNIGLLLGDEDELEELKKKS